MIEDSNLVNPVAPKSSTNNDHVTYRIGKIFVVGRKYNYYDIENEITNPLINLPVIVMKSVMVEALPITLKAI